MDEPDTPALYVHQFKPGQVLRDFVEPESGLRLLVTRGGYCFCAYVGVRADHALAGLEDFSFPCHWGVNFRQWGEPGTPWAEGWYWWGWDYGHTFDAPDFLGEVPTDAPEELLELARELKAMSIRRADAVGGRLKNWTVDEIFEDGLDVVMHLRQALQASGAFAELIPKR